MNRRKQFRELFRFWEDIPSQLTLKTRVWSYLAHTVDNCLLLLIFQDRDVRPLIVLLNRLYLCPAKIFDNRIWTSHVRVVNDYANKISSRKRKISRNRVCLFIWGPDKVFDIKKFQKSRDTVPLRAQWDRPIVIYSLACQICSTLSKGSQKKVAFALLVLKGPCHEKSCSAEALGWWIRP